MKPGSFLFTSESVTEGHPDKMADQVSDAIVDAMIKQDRNSRCAVETLFKTGVCIVAGEVRTEAWVDIPKVVRQKITDIGYTSSDDGFDGFTCGVLVAIEGQSGDIAVGVDSAENKEQGAGDQGMMFGFACDETPELMPLPIAYAHRITRRLSEARKCGDLPWARPDGKGQISVAYNGGGVHGIESVVVSTQHTPDVSQATVREGVVEEVIKKVIPSNLALPQMKIHVNPTGKFVIGGPMGDTGVTGRKIIVDTYGGMGRHGGGAFSGKDASKVDRSAAYMARYIAKNLVAAGIARRCEVQLAYAIGIAEPVSVMVETFGTSNLDDEKLEMIVRKVFPLKPAGIVEHLQLLRPIFEATAAYGHFGRNEDTFTWEKLDKVEELKSEL